jgi:urease accessory protein
VASVGGATVGVLLVVDPAGAHTGLTAAGAADGALHPFLGLDHLLAMVAVGVLAATASSRRIAWLTPVGFLTGMIVGGLAGLAGLELPLVELVIAMSVVALGLAIIVVTENRGLWLPVIAAAFGAAHGHAHGAELPAGALPLAYVVGFVAATAALHLAGTALGVGLRRTPTIRVGAGALVATAGLTLLFAS